MNPPNEEKKLEKKCVCNDEVMKKAKALGFALPGDICSSCNGLIDEMVAIFDQKLAEAMSFKIPNT